MLRVIENKLIGWLVMALAGLLSPCRAQKTVADSTVGLPVVVVEAPRLRHFLAGKKQQTLDSITRSFYTSKSMADVLADESTVFVKAYGPGQLATTAWRGGSAYHSPVVWNGIPITSPMNGQTDFSLIPLEAAGSLRLDYGGGSALWGSGAVAGAVQLISQPVFGEGLKQQMRLSWGSFGDLRHNAMVSFGNERISTVLKAFHAYSENNFSYFRNVGGESLRTRLSHAQVQNAGLISENNLRLGRYQVMSAYLWLQDTRRNLPPTLVQSESLAAQEDRSLRSLVSWSTEKGRLTAFVRMAWLQERLVYADPLVVLADTSRVRQWISEAEGKIRLGKGHSLYTGLHNTRSEAYHPAYDSRAVQNRFAQMMAYQFVGCDGQIKVDLALRHEFFGLRSTPLTGTWSLQYHPVSLFGIKASLARVYRLPTLNDMYWRPGGNPELKPESGYSLEGGIVLNWNIKILKLTTELTAYSRTVDNWIIWLPDGANWAPRNLRKVWSRGAETHTTITLRFHKLCWLLTLMTSYVLSTPTYSATLNDQSVGKQLIYTPMYTGMARLMLIWKGLKVAYRHNYVGFRYVSTDNSQYLPPYDVGALMLAYTAKANSQASLELFLTLNNIWNYTYQVVSQRPMPGFNIQGGLSLSLHLPPNLINQSKRQHLKPYTL
jgi:iron complex outermembrane receptor protein